MVTIESIRRHVIRKPNIHRHVIYCSTRKSESTIQNEIRVALSEYGVVFRTNAGNFWQGKPVFSNEFNQRALINLRPVQGLPIGFSDLIFLDERGIAFIETKRPGLNPKPEQVNFIKAMQNLGHRAGVAHSVEEAIEIVKRTR